MSMPDREQCANTSRRPDAQIRNSSKQAVYSTCWMFCLAQLSTLLQTVSNAAITLPQVKSISQGVPSGMQFASFNIAKLNGVFYSQFGVNFYKTDASPSSVWEVVSPKLATSFVYSTTMLEAIPEANLLLHVDYQGTMTLIDPVDANTPIKNQSRALFYGLFSQAWPNYMQVYQIKRKQGTSYFYLTEVRGTSIYKADVSNWSQSKKITDAPQSETGYEHLAVSSQDLVIVSTINMARMDIYSSSTDKFIQSVTVQHNWGNSVNRGLDYYPLASSKEYFLVVRTGGKAVFYNAIDNVCEKYFQITAVWPEFVKYIPNSHYFVIAHLTKFDFVNVMGTDADSLQFSAAPASSSEFYDFEFLYDNSVSLMAVVTTYNSTAFYNLQDKFCHFSCNGCSRSMDPTACTACKEGYTLTSGLCTSSIPAGQVKNGTTLTSSCPPGLYPNVDRVCQTCSAGCSSCQSVTGFCLQCSVSTQVISTMGVCQASCDPNEYTEVTGGVSKCKKCHPSCASCTGPGQNQCSTCITSTTGTFAYSITDKTCTSPCVALNKSYVLLNDTCDACKSGCNDCPSSDFGGTCLTCPSPNKLIFGFCVPNCLFGTAAYSSPYQRCVLCETVPQGQLFHNGACQDTCPSGFQQSGLNCYPVPPTSPPAPTPSNPTPPPTTPTSPPTSPTTVGSNSSGASNTTAVDPSTVRSPFSGDIEGKASPEQERSSTNTGLILLVLIITGAVVSGLLVCLMYFKRNRASARVAQNPNDINGVVQMDMQTRQPGHRDRNIRQESGDWDLPPIPLQVVNIPESKLIAKETFSNPTGFSQGSSLAPKKVKKTTLGQPADSRSDWQLQGDSNRPINNPRQQQAVGLESSRMNPLDEDPNRDWELDEQDDDGAEEGEYEYEDEMDSARTPSNQPSKTQGQPVPSNVKGPVGEAIAPKAAFSAPKKFHLRGSIKQS